FAFAVRRFIEPPASDDDETPEPLWTALKAALRNPVLVLWLFGTALCDLLDDIFVVFASLHIRHELGASTAWQGIIIGAFIAGGALGLVILERVLARHSERRVLIATCLLCAVSYVLWLAAPTLWLSAILMVPVGVTSAPLYPLAAARAYACCPGRSGIVLAASHLFTPFGLMLPWLLGLVADHAGTHVTLALLIIQPLGLALLARYKAT
ncbi:MAG TPA: MFS transporter, partial [Kofleriaceae bacterium]